MKRIYCILILLILGVGIGYTQDEKRKAPDFSQKDVVSGKTIKLSAMKGKIVLLNFWGTWCVPCKKEITALIKLQKKYKGKIVVVGASLDKGKSAKETIVSYAKTKGIVYPIIMGAPLEKKWSKVEAIPTTYIINRKGIIVKKFMGMQSFEDLNRFISSVND